MTEAVTSTVDRASETLDNIKKLLKLKNDAALSRVLNVAPPAISKIRAGSAGFGSSMIIRVHEVTGLSVRSIKEQLGEPSLDRYAA